MNEIEAKERILELRAEIAKHEELYRIHNAPEISDEDFDALMHTLRTLEKQFPQFYDPLSPSVRVGNDLSASFVSVAHLTPMLSLDNVFNFAELEDFDARLKKILETQDELTYCVEPKIDGAGVSVIYENGNLVRLLTRGNGEKGDDITRNAFAIKNLPRKLIGENIPTLLEIRGEAYMERKEFERIKNQQRKDLIEKALAKKRKEAEKLLNNSTENDVLSDDELAIIEKKLPANPRNLTAGTMKLLDAETLRNRELKVILYSIGTLDGIEIKNQLDLPQTLKNWGLPAVNWHAKAVGAKDAFEKISELEEVRADFPFNTDGAVVKLNDCTLYEKAGMTSHAPRWATAWKYRAERAETRLNAITIQVGRTGVITPVAELEPIENLSGTEVRRATLHNESYIANKDIRIGDTVIVEKAGEIIPAVLGVILEKRPESSVAYNFPTICPECGSPLKKYGEKMLSRCPNISCPPQIRGRIEHFASRGCMDIRGLGEKIVSELVDKLNVKDPSDLYTLTREKLLSLDKFKDKSADNLLESLENSKSRELWRLIFGLGILEIGEQFAKDLASKFGSLDAIINADIEEIKSLEGFGSKSTKKKSDENTEHSVRALSVRVFFDDPHNRELIEKLRSAGLNFTAKQEVLHNSAFAQKIFVLTGTLKSMGRTEAKAIIEKFGGKIASSVTSKTDYLISDGEINGTKAQTAQKLGTKILSEEDFLQMINEAEILATSPEQSPATQFSEQSSEQPTTPRKQEPKSEDNQLCLF